MGHGSQVELGTSSRTFIQVSPPRVCEDSTPISYAPPLPPGPVGPGQAPEP